MNFAAALSLIVCVAALSLWIRGAVGTVAYERWAWDEPALTFRSDFVSLYPGIVSVSTVRQQLDAPPSSNALARTSQDLRLLRRAVPPNSPVDDFIVYSFRTEAKQLGPEHVSQWSLSLRLWPVAVIAAVMPGVWVGRKVRHARRARIGHCPSCGYDLRATPERCPECGTLTTAARAAA